jgi:hypothetical protein
MNKTYTIGLGEPELVGKRALFRPSVEDKKTPPIKIEQGTRRRLRTTIDLSIHTLKIIQEIQTHHRMETGKVLPLWKLVCQAIEFYSKSANLRPKANPQ